MQATNAKDMRGEVGSGASVRDVLRTSFSLSLFLGVAVALTFSFGCGPSPSQGDGTQASSDSTGSSIPEITDQLIEERINDARVRDVLPEDGGPGDPIGWSFDEDEPKEIAVVEKKIDGARATIVLDIKTRSAARAREQRQLAGQIRTEWELRTGWVLRKWEIVDVENISMKYKNLPKPPPQNSNLSPVR